MSFMDSVLMPPTTSVSPQQVAAAAEGQPVGASSNRISSTPTTTGTVPMDSPLGTSTHAASSIQTASIHLYFPPPPSPSPPRPVASFSSIDAHWLSHLYFSRLRRSLPLIPNSTAPQPSLHGPGTAHTGVGGGEGERGETGFNNAHEVASGGSSGSARAIPFQSLPSPPTWLASDSTPRAPLPTPILLALSTSSDVLAAAGEFALMSHNPSAALACVAPLLSCGLPSLGGDVSLPRGGGLLRL